MSDRRKVYINAYSSMQGLGMNVKESIAAAARETRCPVLPVPGKAPDFDTKPYFILNIPDSGTTGHTRCAEIALRLLESIESGWRGKGSIPLFMATSTGGIKETEELYTGLIKNNQKFPLYQKHYFYDIADTINGKYPGLFEESYTFSTACSSAGHSIYHAYKFISSGVMDRAIAIGVDSLSITTKIGFDSLKLVSPDGTKPLTLQRNGLTLGEGGGVLLLESERNENTLGEIAGGFSNSDGYHVTSPNPAGTEQRNCMLKAVESAGISLADVGYVSAHGTGTPVNDKIEMDVVKGLFGGGVKVSSLKGFIGHTLGSSAITEIPLVMDMIRSGRIYQVKGLGDMIDPELTPPGSFDIDTDYFIKNSFGFGGNNVSIVVKVYR